MRGTDELRKWVRDGKGSLLAIADRIDAEHKKAIASVMNDALYHANEKDMAELGWIRLPKDADGEPIHVGERVQLIGNDPSTVSHMSLADDGWRVYVKYDNGLGTGSGEPKRIRHYHKPTVEDVLREMLYKAHIYDEREMELLPDLIADYAKRLTLAEEEGA